MAAVDGMLFMVKIKIFVKIQTRKSVAFANVFDSSRVICEGMIVKINGIRIVARRRVPFLAAEIISHAVVRIRRNEQGELSLASRLDVEANGIESDVKILLAVAAAYGSVTPEIIVCSTKNNCKISC